VTVPRGWTSVEEVTKSSIVIPCKRCLADTSGKRCRHAAVYSLETGQNVLRREANGYFWTGTLWNWRL